MSPENKINAAEAAAAPGSESAQALQWGWALIRQPVSGAPEAGPQGGGHRTRGRAEKGLFGNWLGFWFSHELKSGTNRKINFIYSFTFWSELRGNVWKVLRISLSLPLEPLGRKCRPRRAITQETCRQVDSPQRRSWTADPGAVPFMKLNQEWT